MRWWMIGGADASVDGVKERTGGWLVARTHMRMVGWRGAWLDGWMERCMGKRLAVRTLVDCWIDGRLDQWLDGWTGRQIAEYVDGTMVGRLGGRAHGCAAGLRDTWVGVWMEGCLGGGELDGWMHRRMLFLGKELLEFCWICKIVLPLHRTCLSPRGGREEVR